MKGNVYIHTYNGCKEINHEGCLEDDVDSRNGEYSVSRNPNHENVIYTPCDRGKSTPMVKRNQKKTKLFLSPPQSKQSSLFLTQDLVLFFLKMKPVTATKGDSWLQHRMKSIQSCL